jgi:hypothetical protein
MIDPDFMKTFFKYIINPHGDNDDDPWKTWRIKPDAPEEAVTNFNNFIETMREAEKRGIQF